jgi:hypothetical protein
MESSNTIIATTKAHQRIEEIFKLNCLLKNCPTISEREGMPIVSFASNFC